MPRCPFCHIVIDAPTAYYNHTKQCCDKTKRPSSNASQSSKLDDARNQPYSHTIKRPDARPRRVMDDDTEPTRQSGLHFISCEFCGRNVLSRTALAHRRICEAKHRPVAPIESPPASPPHEPVRRNRAIAEKTASPVQTQPSDINVGTGRIGMAHEVPVFSDDEDSDGLFLGDIPAGGVDGVDDAGRVGPVDLDQEVSDQTVYQTMPMPDDSLEGVAIGEEEGSHVISSPVARRIQTPPRGMPAPHRNDEGARDRKPVPARPEVVRLTMTPKPSVTLEFPTRPVAPVMDQPALPGPIETQPVQPLLRDVKALYRARPEGRTSFCPYCGVRFVHDGGFCAGCGAGRMAYEDFM